MHPTCNTSTDNTTSGIPPTHSVDTHTHTNAFTHTHTLYELQQTNDQRQGRRLGQEMTHKRGRHSEILNKDKMLQHPHMQVDSKAPVAVCSCHQCRKHALGCGALEHREGHPQHLLHLNKQSKHTQTHNTTKVCGVLLIRASGIDD